MPRRLPIYILIDDNSFSTEYSNQVVGELYHQLCETLRKDPYTLETVHVSLIHFSDEAVLQFPLTEISTVWQRPDPRDSRQGNLLAGIDLLAQQIERELVKPSNVTRGDWQPIVLIFSSGEFQEQKAAVFHKFGFLRTVTPLLILPSSKFQSAFDLGYDKYFEISSLYDIHLKRAFQWITVKQVQERPISRINLNKRRRIDLQKAEFNFSKVTVALGWNRREQGIWNGVAGETLPEYNLELIAFLLDEQDKIRNFGHEKVLPDGRKIGLADSDVIFSNNLIHLSGAVRHGGPCQTGGYGGDDETIDINLRKLPSYYKKAVFVVCMYQGRSKNQHFGELTEAFVRAFDANGKEFARYSLSSDPSFHNQCSMIFGEIYIKDGQWKFRTIGNSFYADSFVEILKSYT